jgi:Protein of unknown function (DUF2934)
MQREYRTIRELAYQIWEQRGRPDGTAQEDWLEAERRLSAVEPAAASKTTWRRTKDRRTKDRRAEDPNRQAKPPPTPTPSSPRQ